MLKYDKNKIKIKGITEWISCIIIAIILALIVRYFIGTPTVVKMVSMYPTLEERDRLILNRTMRIHKQTFKRGDIITFEAPSKKQYSQSEVDTSNPIAKYEYKPNNLISKFIYNVLEIGKESYIKRIIALPGEHVEIKDGKVYINGNILEENYLREGINTYSDTFYDFVVPENCVFAMGDNRNESMDCRNFGCIPMDKIEGIVIFRFWPLNKFRK